MEKERLSETDRLKEEIRFKVERAKISIGVFLLNLGGTISLMLDGPDRGGEIIFCSAGILISFGLFRYCWQEYHKLKTLLKV